MGCWISAKNDQNRTYPPGHIKYTVGGLWSALGATLSFLPPHVSAIPPWLSLAHKVSLYPDILYPWYVTLPRLVIASRWASGWGTSYYLLYCTNSFSIRKLPARMFAFCTFSVHRRIVGEVCVRLCLCCSRIRKAILFHVEHGFGYPNLLGCNESWTMAFSAEQLFQTVTEKTKMLLRYPQRVLQFSEVPQREREEEASNLRYRLCCAG